MPEDQDHLQDLWDHSAPPQNSQEDRGVPSPDLNSQIAQLMQSAAELALEKQKTADAIIQQTSGQFESLRQYHLGLYASQHSVSLIDPKSYIILFK